MPKYALTPVEYDEISFVHAGANPDADIVLAKANTSKMCPDSGDMHVDGPMKMAGKKKKLTRTEIAKLLQDHADLVSHDVDNRLDPKVSKSTDYDPEIIETLRDSQEVIN